MSDHAEAVGRLTGRKPCCDQGLGGSHYHCGHCGKASGMYGHFVRSTFRDGTPFEGFTCRDGVRRVWDQGGMFVESVV